MEIAVLISRLNHQCRDAMERAAQRSWQRNQHFVEIEHLMLELLEIEGGDLACLLPALGLERDRLASEINLALELFKTGNTRTPTLSKQLLALIEDAVVQASVFGATGVRSGLLLLALLDRDEYRALLQGSIPSLLGHGHELGARRIAGNSEQTRDAAVQQGPIFVAIEQRQQQQPGTHTRGAEHAGLDHGVLDQRQQLFGQRRCAGITGLEQLQGEIDFTRQAIAFQPQRR